MTGEKSGIGQLYRDTFSNFEMKESNSSEWAAIETKLSYLNFMHFGLYNFNIYYALLIAGSIVLNIYLGINYFSAKQNDNMNNLIPSDSTLILNKADSFLNNNHTIQNIDSEDVNTKKQVNTDLNTGEKQPIDKNEHLIKKSVSQKKFNTNVADVNSKPEKMKSEPGNYNIITDSLPEITVKGINRDSVTNVEVTDTITEDLNIPGKTEKKTIFIKPQDVIERDTVIIYKKQKR